MNGIFESTATNYFKYDILIIERKEVRSFNDTVLHAQKGFQPIVDTPRTNFAYTRGISKRVSFSFGRMTK